MEKFILNLIRVYSIFFRPITSTIGSCRFVPSCSDYASEAIRQYGVLSGMARSLWRILRCHPFSQGGVDLP